MLCVKSRYASFTVMFHDTRQEAILARSFLTRNRFLLFVCRYAFLLHSACHAKALAPCFMPSRASCSYILPPAFRALFLPLRFAFAAQNIRCLRLLCYHYAVYADRRVVTYAFHWLAGVVYDLMAR